MKKTLLLLSLTLYSISLFSQQSELFYAFGNLIFEENTTAYLFGNNVRLREEPSTSSVELKKLPILEKITLLEKTEIKYTINGIESHWIKVKANNTIGYILDYFISASYIEDGGFFFLTRINKEKEKLYLEIRKVDQEENNAYNVEKINIEIPHSNIAVNTYDNKGLAGITGVIFIEHVAEACGMQGGGEYLLLKEGEIIFQLKIDEIFEAGMFGKSEKIVFPNDNENLDKNTIKFIQEINTTIDESSQWYEKKIIERQHRLIDNKFVPEFKSERVLD